MDIKEFVKKEARENLAREFTKEGLFELKEQEIRGNNYHVFANLPQTLRDYFQFPGPVRPHPRPPLYHQGW